MKLLEQMKQAKSVTLEDNYFCLTPKAMCLDIHIILLPCNHQKKNAKCEFSSQRLEFRGERGSLQDEEMCGFMVYQWCFVFVDTILEEITFSVLLILPKGWYICMGFFLTNSASSSFLSHGVLRSPTFLHFTRATLACWNSQLKCQWMAH